MKTYLPCSTYEGLPPILPALCPKERQVPAEPGVDLLVVPDPPPPGAQEPRDPHGPPLVLRPLGLHELVGWLCRVEVFAGRLR